MIVVGIIAILLGLAIPNYFNGIRKGHRADAQSIMIEFAGRASRILTETSTYADLVLPENTDYYTFSFPSDPTVNAYSIRATPSSSQAKDGCGTMTLTSTGKRTKTGSEKDCWR